MKTICNILLVVIVLTSACKPRQESGTESNSSTETEDIMPFFIISSGGGFTGKYNYYKIYQSGEVQLLNEETEEYEIFKTVSVDNANYIFSNLNALKLWELNYNVPGNMTYTIEIMKEGQMHVVKWADGDQNIDPKIQEFFSNTMNSILE